MRMAIFLKICHSFMSCVLGKTSPIKMAVELRGLSLEGCQQTLWNIAHLNITRGQICAGGRKGQDSCQGDSGGPLQSIYYPDGAANSYWILDGIISFGVGQCGTGGNPGVYTNVAQYMGWIQKNIV